MGAPAHSEEPDQTPQVVTSHQCLVCHAWIQKGGPTQLWQSFFIDEEREDPNITKSITDDGPTMNAGLVVL